MPLADGTVRSVSSATAVVSASGLQAAEAVLQVHLVHLTHSYTPTRSALLIL